MRDFNIKKLYYSISEVSKITDVEPYILRYWEKEFDELKPQKNRSGKRVYTTRDIKLILFIKSLLKDKKYTTEGARGVIEQYDFDSKDDDFQIEMFEQNSKTKDGKSIGSSFANDKESSQKKDVIKNDLLQLKNLLEELLNKL